MRRSFAIGVLVCMLLAVAAPALAGTTTIDFQSGTGLLTHHASGTGTLTTVSGRAHFTGPNTTQLEQGGSVISSGGTVVLTMTLQPSVDAVNGVGLVITGGGHTVTAIADSSGNVTMTAGIGLTLHFADPASSSNSFSLAYDAVTKRASLTLTPGASANLDNALSGATSVQVGAISNGVGDFSRFVATGPGIPDYPNEFTFTQAPMGGWFEEGVPYTMGVEFINAQGSVTYQWSKNGVAITGATDETLGFAALATTDTGSYACVVTDTAGPHTSASAALLVVEEGELPVCGLAGLLATAGLVLLGYRRAYRATRRTND